MKGGQIMPDKRTINRYISKITDQTKALRTYQPEFNTIIQNFAELLSERDRVLKQYMDEGSRPVITHRSDRGAVNTVKNPLLLMWLDLTAEARKYANELGLTPKALRTLSDVKIQPPKAETPLEKVLREIEERQSGDDE